MSSLPRDQTTLAVLCALCREPGRVRPHEALGLVMLCDLCIQSPGSAEIYQLLQAATALFTAFPAVGTRPRRALVQIQAALADYLDVLGARELFLPPAPHLRQDGHDQSDEATEVTP